MINTGLSYFPPINGRTHEVCGAGANVFAFALAAILGGSVMWVRENWDTRQINPGGFADFIPPSSLLLCNVKNQMDMLAVTEEALRAGAVPLVVLTLSQPIGLTAGRRLQLAARDGKSTGLAIIPEGLGSNAAETRWRCTPVFDTDANAGDSTLHNWQLIKNKSGTLGAWYVRWDHTSRRIALVSPSRQ